MKDGLIQDWGNEHEDFLRDESRRIGEAQSISFPTCEEDVCDIVRSINTSGGSITTQGARTGIVAGAVPQGGHVLNLSRMKHIEEVQSGNSGKQTVTVQPGALLDEIREAVSTQSAFFPPDPTETSAAIGGMVASNASGAMSFFYGPTRNWIESLRVVLGDGDVISLKRGECFASGRTFSVTTESGKVISGALPAYNVPAVKSAAGYYVADNMDLIDLFIGMEGTLGIVTEINLSLINKPAALCGLTVFLPDEASALQLVRVLRCEQADQALQVRPVAIELFNSDALNLLRNAKEKYSAFSKIPALKPHYHTAIYTEFHRENDDELEEIAMQVMEAAMDLGGSDEDTWYATNDHELEPQKAFRHATPEAVNLLIDERRRIDPDITKLGTDMSVPDEQLEHVVDMYNRDLALSGLESVIFGHVGNNHLHVNILPNNQDEYAKGKALYMSWAKEVVSVGGSVSAEHGIGKLKTAFLEMMYGPEAIEEMRALKLLFDPNRILNPGNLF